MEQVRFQLEPGLAGTGTAHNQNILIPGILGVGWAIGHHQPLCLRQNDIVLKLWCHKWGNVLGITPPGGAVFLVVTVLLRVLSFEIHRQSQPHSTNHAYTYPPNQTAGQEDQEQVAQAVSLSPYCFGFPFSFFAEKMQIARPVPQHSCGLLSLILKKITAEGIPFCGD